MRSAVSVSGARSMTRMVFGLSLGSSLVTPRRFDRFGFDDETDSPFGVKE